MFEALCQHWLLHCLEEGLGKMCTLCLRAFLRRLKMPHVVLATPYGTPYLVNPTVQVIQRLPSTALMTASGVLYCPRLLCVPTLFALRLRRLEMPLQLTQEPRESGIVWAHSHATPRFQKPLSPIWLPFTAHIGGAHCFAVHLRLQWTRPT